MKSLLIVFVSALTLFQCERSQEITISLDSPLHKLYQLGKSPHEIRSEKISNRLPYSIKNIARIKAATDSLIVGDIVWTTDEHGIPTSADAFFYVDHCCLGLFSEADGHYVKNVLTLSDTTLAKSCVIEFAGGMSNHHRVQFWADTDADFVLNGSTNVWKAFFPFDHRGVRDINYLQSWAQAKAEQSWRLNFKPVTHNRHAFWQEKLEELGYTYEPPFLNP
ncbi:MAG: hypothetical protein AAF206_30065 [Bacteroidota bacterium]